MTSTVLDDRRRAPGGDVTDEPDGNYTALPAYMAAEFTALAALAEPAQQGP